MHRAMLIVALVFSPNITVWSDTKYPWPKNRLQRKPMTKVDRTEKGGTLILCAPDGCD